MFDDAGGYASARQAWGEAAQLQLRVITALLRRETRAHFGESRLGYLWAVIEPSLHLIMYGVLFKTVLLRHSPVAGGVLTFCLTGLVPYFLYSKVAQYLTTAIPGNKPLLNLPPVKPLDVLISRAFLESVTYIIAGAIMLVALFLRGDPHAIPRFPLTLAGAVILTCLFGFGVGMINAVLQVFISTWSLFFSIFLTPFYFLSGIFFVVEEVPQPFRDYLLYNPILQLVQWFRRGFYVDYSTPYFYPGYILWWTVAVLAIGFTLVRLLRRKLLEVT